MVAVLLEEKVIGHTGNVVADDDMARNDKGLLFVVRRHGIAFAEKKMEKSLETFDGVVAVFGDDRMGVEMGNEESLESSILRGDLLAEPSETVGVVANFFDRRDFGFSGAGCSGFDQIGSKSVQDVLERFAEFELFLGDRMGASDAGVGVSEERNFGAEKVEVEELGFARVVEVGRVVGDFVHPVDEL